jgi:asparagine synthase (glutamine-hydrolysing)
MFAFALWDEREQQLFCARDRLGEKPFLYHYEAGRLFIFASEMKALFAAGVEAALNERQLFHYLAHDVVQDPARPTETFYRGVTSLEPAHTLTVRRDGSAIVPRRYWRLDPAPPPSPLTLQEASEKLRALLEESVRRRLRSDVTVGTSLSGGLDSSSIVCLMAGLRGLKARAPNAFSARFDDPRLDEGPHIQTVVAQTGVAQHYTWPDGAGLAEDLERVFHHQEEPFGSASVFAQWRVMRLAQEAGTIVLLDGQGPDEMLAGYHHFAIPYLRRLYRTNRAAFLRGARLADASVRAALGWRFRLDATFPRLYRRMVALWRWYGGPAVPPWLSRDFTHSFAHEAPPFRSFDDLDGALRFFTQDYGLRTLLRYADRNSMAFGREVRLPFLFHELVEFVFTLPDAFKLSEGVTKLVLREAVAGVVPESIRERTDKLGLETPQNAWLEHPAVRRRLEAAAENLAREGFLADPEVPLDGAWRVLMGDLLVRSIRAARKAA